MHLGGIETWRDALEFIVLGADTVQVTTAVMQYGYRIIDDIKDGVAIEDGEGRVTMEMLEENFSEEICEAVRQLTHDPAVPYLDYVNAMSSPIALNVKRNDLTNNMDLSRIPHPEERDYRRLEKYRKALEIIESKLK